MTPEGQVKKELREYLDSLAPHCWYYQPVPMGYGKRGVPDFIVCYKGFFLAPETKRKSKGVAGPLQDRNQKEIWAAGGDSDFVTTVDVVKEWVKRADKMAEALDDFTYEPRNGN